jgi:hypothetical protein
MSISVLRVVILAALAAAPGLMTARAADESVSRPALADLAWLAGTWTFERNGRTVTEHWLPPAGGTMLGVSRTVAGERTVEYEFIVLRETAEGGLVFEAHPSGQAGAEFPLVRWSARELVFENTAHDFPQRIVYTLNDDGSLLAAIEGERNGKLRRVEFPYRRVRSAATDG